MKKHKKLQNFAKCLLLIFLGTAFLFGCAESSDDEPLPTEIIISEPEDLPVEPVSDEVEEIPVEEPSVSESVIVENKEIPEKAVLPEVSSKQEQISAPVSTTENDTSGMGATMVWIPTKGGKKYHRTAGCSNMSNPQSVSLSEAEEKGFTACKRCY